MKILYVAGRWPWPVQVGRQRMIDQTLKLASEIGEAHLLAFAEGQPAVVPDHVRLAGALPMPGSPEIAANLAMHPFWPLQCHLFNSAAARSQLEQAIGRIAPDVVVIDMLRLYPFAQLVRRRFPAIRLVLDMDDLLSLRYMRMLRNKRQGSISGTFERKIPGPLRALARALPRLLLHLEKPLIGRLERKALDLFDAILLVSPAEAAKLASGQSVRPVLGFPPIIEQRTAPARSHAHSLRFVFIGSGNYAPNAEALGVLDRAAGRLRRKLPNPPVPYRIEAAGVVNPNLSLSNVVALGFVDDLGSFLGADAVLTAPILTGTGVKTKIVDALEYATPIITTPVGAEGLPLEPGRHFIRVENEADLAAAMERLIVDHAARTELAPMGQAALQAAYGGANQGRLLSVLKQALGAGG